MLIDPLALDDQIDAAENKKYELQKKYREITDLARQEKRDLRSNEQDKIDSLQEKIAAASDEANALIEQRRAARENTPRRTILPGGSRPTMRRDTPTLTREERMADWAAEQPNRDGFEARDADDFCLGNIMRSMVDPSYRSKLTDVEKRALAEGTDSAGGFITPERLSTNVIDRIRNNMAVMQAGATTVPLDTDKQSIPRLTGGVSGAWRNENTAFATTQPTFDRVNFAPKSYGFIVLTSEELFQDMVPGGGHIIESELTQAAALELDRVALRGSGTAPEPQGIRNQAGVTIQSLGTNGAALTNYSTLMTSVTTLLTANRKPNAVILSPRSSQSLANLADTTNQPLNPPRPVEDLDFYVTSQVPNNLTHGTSNVASEIYVGFWPDLLIGVRLGVELRLLRERYADTGQFAWRVHMRMDVQLAHPESFVVQTGVL